MKKLFTKLAIFVSLIWVPSSVFRVIFLQVWAPFFEGKIDLMVLQNLEELSELLSNWDLMYSALACLKFLLVRFLKCFAIFQSSSSFVLLAFL